MSGNQDDEGLPPARPGPIDDRPWPSTMRGHVIDPGPPTRVHGFDLLGDLTRHYDWGEVVLTTLRGEAPTQDEGRAFGHAMSVLLPIPVTEAPVHAAVLARLMGSESSGVASTGAIVLCEQARDLVARVRDELPRLIGETPTGDGVETSNDLDPRVLQLLGDALIRLGCAEHRLSAASCVEASALAVLYACGLRQAWQLETALIMARLPTVTAEARHHRPGRFAEYPMNRPRFRYRDETGEHES